MSLSRLPWMAVLITLALYSCTPKVQFNEPMPPGRMNLPNIPKAMRGVIIEDGERWELGKDTLKMGDEVLVNGEDFLLRRMAGHIILSQPVVETGRWEVFPIRKTKDTMYMGYFEDDDTFLKRMSTLLSATPEQEKSASKPSYRYYVLSPTAKEFKTILKERLYDGGEEGLPLPKGGEVRP